MWRFKFSILLAYSLSVSVYAQNNWQKIISNGDVIYTRSVIQLLDSNYLILGSSNGYGDYSANAYIMKINKWGNPVWTKWFGGQHTEWFYQGIQNTDSTMVFAGYTNSFGYGGYDIYVVKTDKNGNVIWQKNFGGQDWDFAYSIQKTYDGAYIICGETYSYGNGNNDAFLLKIDDNGDSLWMYTYGGLGNDAANKVIELSNQHIAFAGTTNSAGFGLEDTYIVLCDNNGTLISDYIIGTPLSEQSISLVETQTNHIIVTGTKYNTLNNSYDINAIKIDFSGNIVWNDFFGGNNEEVGLNLVYHPTYNIYYYVGSTESYGQGLKDFVVYGFTEYLGFNYANTFGTLHNELCYAAAPTLDDGLILAGDTDFGNGIRSAYIVKLNNTFITPPPAQNIQDITGILSNNRTEQFFLYPNPSSDMVFLKGNTSEIKRLQVTDISGKIFFDDNYKHALNCTYWPSGFYFMKIINTDDSFQMLTFIINH